MNGTRARNASSVSAGDSIGISVGNGIGDCALAPAYVAPLAEAIGRHDADLARQFRRAMSSVPLNVSEGAAQRGARRNSHYSIALGSAREALSALRTAAAWGYVPEPPADITARFDRVMATLYVNAQR